MGCANAPSTNRLCGPSAADSLDLQTVAAAVGPVPARAATTTTAGVVRQQHGLTLSSTETSPATSEHHRDLQQPSNHYVTMKSSVSQFRLPADPSPKVNTRRLAITMRPFVDGDFLDALLFAGQNSSKGGCLWSYLWRLRITLVAGSMLIVVTPPLVNEVHNELIIAPLRRRLKDKI